MFTKANAEAYFAAEKTNSLIFLVIGVVMILLSVVGYTVLKTSFYKGMATPLFLLGIIIASACWTVYQRSDKQRIDIVYKMDLNPQAIQQQEIPRMQKVMRNFGWLYTGEIICMIAGAVLFFLFRRNENQQYWAGLGASLAVVALLLLAADSLAAKRGGQYLGGLKQFVASPGKPSAF